MYKLIIFDMDGTLADTDAMIVHSFEELYRLYRPDYKYKIEDIYYFSGPPIDKTLIEQFPDQDVKFMHQEFLRISLPNYKKYVTAYKDSREVLEELKKRGYKLAVVTNKYHVPTMMTIDLIGLNGIFDLVIGFDDVKNGKPDPEGINKCLSFFNVKKEEALYIGDTYYDYLTAMAGHIDCGLVTWTPRIIKEEIKVKYLIPSYSYLLEVLK